MSETTVTELLSAAKTAEKWMQSWLDEKLCECEGYHYCGRTEREAELAQIKTAIRKAMGNGRMSDESCDCDDEDDFDGPEDDCYLTPAV